MKPTETLSAYILDTLNFSLFTSLWTPMDGSPTFYDFITATERLEGEWQKLEQYVQEIGFLERYQINFNL